MKLQQQRYWRGRDSMSALTPFFLVFVQMAMCNSDTSSDAGNVDAFPGVDAEPPSELTLPSLQDMSEGKLELNDQQHPRSSNIDADPKPISGQSVDGPATSSAPATPVPANLQVIVPSVEADMRHSDVGDVAAPTPGVAEKPSAAGAEQMHELMGELNGEQIQQDALIELHSQKVHLDQQAQEFAQVASEPDAVDGHAVPSGVASTVAAAKLESAPSGGPSLQELVAEVDDGSSKAEARFKDDSVQTALAYIGNRLKSDAQKNVRLQQMAVQSVELKRDLQSKSTELGRKRKEVAMLQLRLHETSQQEALESNAIKAQHSRLRTVEQHLANASRTVDHDASALKWANERLADVRKTNADLHRKLDAATSSNQELSKEYAASKRSHETDEKSLRAGSTQLKRTQESLRKTQEQLHALQAAKADEDERLRRSMRRQRDSDKLDKLADRELSVLTQRLGSEEALEEHARQSWSKERESLGQEVRALRVNATESHDSLQRVTREARDLHKEVSLLKHRVWDGDRARQEAVRQQEGLQLKLREAVSELTRLRGLVPQLQDEMERQKLVAQNATEQAHIAHVARQDLKASLATSQRIIMQLQSQYADALQVLVAAQSGADSPSAQTSPQQQQQQLRPQPPATVLPSQPAVTPTPLMPPSQFLAPQPGSSSGQGKQDASPGAAAVASATPELQLKLDSQGLRTLLMGLTGNKR